MFDTATAGVKRLDEIVEVLDHLRVPVNSGERYSRQGPVPYYGANGQQGWIDEPLFDEPLILLAEDGGNFDNFATRPIAYRIDGPSWVNNHAHVIRSVNGVHQDFVFWSLVHKDIRRFIAGGTRTKLNQSELRSIEVWIPYSLEEQRSIADILDTLDTQIRQTEAIIAKLQQAKQGLLHDLLTRGVDVGGQLRPPRVQTPELYKQSPLGWIPREWEAVTLSDIITSIGQGWSPDCEQEPAGQAEWGVLKTTSVTWNGYDETQNKRLPVALRSRPALEVVAGDILVTRAGPKERVGVVSYVPKTRPNLMISDKIYCLRVSPKHNPYFVSMGLGSSIIQSQLSKMISGMADSQTNISQGILMALPFFDVPLDEQIVITKIWESSSERLKGEGKLLAKLKTQKAGLMDDLLTGRVRVTELTQSLLAS